MCHKIYRVWNNKYCNQIKWNGKITAENILKSIYNTAHVLLESKNKGTEGKDGQTRRRLKRITIAVLENLLALQLFQSLFLLFVTRGGLSMVVKWLCLPT